MRPAALAASIACSACGGVDADSGVTPHDDGGVEQDSCSDGSEFTIIRNEVSPKIPTVGIVEWSLAGAAPSEAKIVYALKRGASSTLNKGGEAPVDLRKRNYRTLLLGLKQSEDYLFHIEATRGKQTCLSEEFALPTTGSLPAALPVTVQVTQGSKREPGFIVTSSGTSAVTTAFIVDADGDVVWNFDAPVNPTRAQMDYEGNRMWMISLNLDNWGGEMRCVSMDGEQEQRNVPGLEHAHHDFTVMPGGRIAALSWARSGIDTESDLVIRSPNGSVTRAFTLGSSLYHSDTFHANAVHYIPHADSFTVADRNPNLFLKVSATGVPQWQLGGACTGVPAGTQCSPRDWDVVHGHHLLENGTFLAFNNTYTEVARVFEFELRFASSSLAVTLVNDYAAGAASKTLGDVQRLPGGNTLITYSGDGVILELDSSWNKVQTFSGRFGYSNWRRTLYGPPLRL